jgi:cell division protein FtsL
MGLPALKQEARPVARRPQLRVAKPGEKAKPSAKRAASSAHRASYQAFVFFAAVVAVVALLGVGRVWLSVQAAQASIDSGKLQSAIKAARYEGDTLEIQQSALATPSRIQGIACGQLGMAPATSVSYLKLGEDPHVVAEAPVTAPGAAQPVLDKVIGVVADQARLLLVGDVGLASTR